METSKEAPEENADVKMPIHGERFDLEVASEVLEAFAHFRNHGHVTEEGAIELTKVYFTAAYMPSYEVEDESEDPVTQ